MNADTPRAILKRDLLRFEIRQSQYEAYRAKCKAAGKPPLPFSSVVEVLDVIEGCRMPRRIGEEKTR